VNRIVVDGESVSRGADRVAVEEPLEIRVIVDQDGRPERHSIAVTMRTPGHDVELAAGFLFTEGALSSPEVVREIGYSVTRSSLSASNVIAVTLVDGTPFDAARLTRNVYTTSSCGVCGKTSLELVRASCEARPKGDLRLTPAFLHALPGRLREAQPRFGETGGEHGAALFDASGTLLLAREDVGRHNAVDKIVGSLFLAESLPASDRILLVSGRASFELVQKALVAGIPVLASVGAPTSLAVDLALEFGMTLVGFLRDDRFNIYSGEERVG
jgi:FdhD protein